MKVFWRETTIREEADGFNILLDGKPIRTPAKALLAVPTEALAEALAAEWRAQSGAVRPADMPLTRAANTVIDRVEPNRDAVVAEIARYGETDLLCHRAGHPQALADRQAAAWDPLLDWAGEVLGAPLRATLHLTHCGQPRASLDAIREAVAAHDPWRLTALRDLAALSGSAIIGLAVGRGRLAVEEAWAVSRIDEDWNVAQWGEDAEARALAENRREAFETAGRLLRLLDEAERPAPSRTGGR